MSKFLHNKGTDNNLATKLPRIVLQKHSSQNPFCQRIRLNPTGEWSRDMRKRDLTLYNTIPTLTTPRKKAFENIVGKGENAGNQHFLLFPQCFLPFLKQIPIFGSHLYCRLQVLSIWTGLKFCIG